MGIKHCDVSVRCTVCKSTDIERCLSLGPQPLSTCFETTPASHNAPLTSELSLGVCHRCATVQLVDRFSLKMLQRKSPRVRFREPQAHLPLVVDKLLKMGAVNRGTKIVGLSYIDDDLLSLLASHASINIKKLGFPENISGQQGVGLETIQNLLSCPGAAQRINLEVGEVDVVCARFILEHAESALEFLETLTNIVQPNGYLIIEVPDSRKMLQAGNHALIWEDHFSYFSLDSLRLLAAEVGASIVDLSRYSYAYEDTLFAILKVGDKPVELHFPIANAEQLANEINEVRSFAQSFDARRINLCSELEVLISKGERLAIFGAGHHTVKLINFYGIEKYIEFVVDDNPEKNGLYVPGTDILIKNSDFLLNSKITACLSTLSPETENKVRHSLAEFFGHGGRFIPVLF